MKLFLLELITLNLTMNLNWSFKKFRFQIKMLPSSGAIHLKSLQTPSPGQSLLVVQSFFWHPTFSSFGFPKNPSGQMQFGRWPLAWQIAFLPQMTGPSQTFLHSRWPKFECSVVQDSSDEQSSLLRHFSAWNVKQLKIESCVAAWCSSCNNKSC